MKPNPSQDGNDGNPGGQTNQSKIAQLPDGIRCELSEALEDAELVLDLVAIDGGSSAQGKLGERRALVTSQLREVWDSGKVTDCGFKKFTLRTRLTVSALMVLSDIEEESWKPLNGSCGDAAEQLDYALEAVEKAMGEGKSQA